MKRTFSLAWVAILLIGLIAALAAVNLLFLRRLHSRNVHDAAAQSVLDLGTELARNLAGQPAVQAIRADPRRWGDFSRLVRSIKRVEPSLQYVNVNEGDLTLFHEDTSVSGGEGAAEPERAEVRIGRKLLATGAEEVPVLTFSARVPDASGQERVVQVAMRKEAVQQREEQASRTLEIMFKLSLTTLLVALGLAVVIGIWMFRQEMERQRRRRDEEHLAFAGLLADGIIHDVRNPMSSLRLDVQMLEKEAGKGREARMERLAELAVRARGTLDRMDLVMREFLYVSRPHSREVERFDLNACVRDSLNLLGPRLEQASIRVVCRLSEFPLELTGQSVAVKRAIINILTNAKQASPEGGQILISSWREGPHAMLAIEDEGPGIPARSQARIFDMFVSGRPDGIGLGLYLAKAAVENAGGHITASNREAGGACFTLVLPLATDHA